jgi:hypothetical protein
MRYKRRQKQIFNIETTQINPSATFIQQDILHKRDTPCEGSRKKKLQQKKIMVFYMKNLSLCHSCAITINKTQAY